MKKKYLALIAVAMVMIAVAVILLVLRGGDENENGYETDADRFDQYHAQIDTFAHGLRLDPRINHQTMEGFGFFGAHDVWWSSAPFDTPEALAWIDTVLIDLGLTMWRNEPYPFVPPYSLQTTNPQDSNWDEQKYFVKALNDRALELGVPLRIILTVWSPPGEWKISGTTRSPIHPEPNFLWPHYYERFAYWLVDVLEMYRDIGVEVYAISPQNEPAFGWQGYNSAFYSSISYTDMLNVVSPIISRYFPDVYIFGAEGMLEHEHSSWGTSFHQRIVSHASEEALHNFVFAHHGYADGLVATEASALDGFWAAERDLIGPDARVWMTETSGYFHTWLDESDQRPGALSLAAAIQSAILHGDISAWVYWQGQEGHSRVHPSEFSLMNFVRGWPLYKYSASRHFYRYIRPGAVRIGAAFVGFEDDMPTVSAFVHDGLGNATVVIVNTEDQSFEVPFSGLGSYVFDILLTDGSSDTIEHVGTITSNEILHIPAHSIITLISGTYRESAPTDLNLTQRDVELAVRALQRVSNGGTTFVTGDSFAQTYDAALVIAESFIRRWAFYLDWEIIDPVFTAATDTAGYLRFRVRVRQGDYSNETSELVLWIHPPETGDGVLRIHRGEYFQTIEGLGTDGINLNLPDASMVRLNIHNTPPTDLDENVRVLLSVMSPPQHMMEGYVLLPEHYVAFAQWVVENVQTFIDAGLNVYGVSLAHEPLWAPSEHTRETYIAMMAAASPLIRAALPDIKIFGPSNVRTFEVADWALGWSDFTNVILRTDGMAAHFDAFAVHSERGGATLDAITSNSVDEWQRFYDAVGGVHPIWNTQFHAHNLSGMWHSEGYDAGALLLAMEVQIALYHGNVSAWFIHQSVGGANIPVLTHFFRIRPGAVRVGATHTLDQSNVLITAWQYGDEIKIIIVNPDEAVYQLEIEGGGVFDMFITTGTDIAFTQVEAVNGFVEIPANSIITLEGRP
ncbi:MAG: hypothetical protein FWC71_03445 [Defluviitaleaceae bacterium]|nr:hypothetical protein [Defluviitaleaceae bacterium]